ncbi:MAG: tyrosine-type recombinase/integrase [Candidatus Limnocylindrales bacterium]|jgi:integrase/recombinase XerC
MTAQPLPALTSGDPSAWDQALYAFLVEKGNRSGSRRTVESYGRMLWPFFADLGRTPERVKPADVLGWAYGVGQSGKTPSATTIGARIACLSSYFRFLFRMGLVISNPCDAVERPRATQSIARGYGADEVRRLLAVVPDTVAGRRDRAILLTLVLTGRRRAEVIGLKAGDLSLEGEVPFYRYVGKGHKVGRRELPGPAFAAILRTLADVDKHLETMDASESLWQAGARPAGVTSGVVYCRFRGYLRAAGLAPSGLHILRHSAARLRRQAGQSIEEVSSFLDHSSLQVTSVYLRRLEGQEDKSWREVAQAIGVGG